MSNSVLEGIIKDKDYSFKKLLFKIVKEYNLSVDELLLLIFFLNQDVPSLNLSLIKEVTLLSEKDILAAFTSLTNHKLLSMNITKENSGKVRETIDLSSLYQAMVSDINKTIKKQNETNIFDTFEHEFGRTLSPIEFEIIDEWVKSGMNEELIIGALKEATYNGVRNLRYIDKIIYEWGKKGFKTMEDVNNHLNNKDKKEEKKELFEYNWLEDE